MGQNSNIEWTDHTANLWEGCEEVHAGCDNCYARVLSNRWKRNLWGKAEDGSINPRMLRPNVWASLKKMQADAAKAGEIHRVFVGSMMDIFEKPMPLVDTKGNPIEGMTTADLRDRFFNEVVPNSPNLMFLLLTKRPSNINKFVPAEWLTTPPENVMYGASAVDQLTFDRVIYHLAKVKGRKFLSVEPQLAYIKLRGLFSHDMDWIIQGGESGHHKRPFDLTWAYSMKKQCEVRGIPYFFKQIDKVKTIPPDLQIRQFPLTLSTQRVVNHE
jgi:protein gp37